MYVKTGQKRIVFGRERMIYADMEGNAFVKMDGKYHAYGGGKIGESLQRIIRDCLNGMCGKKPKITRENGTNILTLTNGEKMTIKDQSELRLAPKQPSVRIEHTTPTQPSVSSEIKPLTPTQPSVSSEIKPLTPKQPSVRIEQERPEPSPPKTIVISGMTFRLVK
jgi:hypothetical protein